MDDKFKTTIVIPKGLSTLMASVTDRIGVSRSAFMCIASAKLAIEMAKTIHPGKKRQAILVGLQSELQKLIRDVL